MPMFFALVALGTQASVNKAPRRIILKEVTLANYLQV